MVAYVKVVDWELVNHKQIYVGVAYLAAVDLKMVNWEVLDMLEIWLEVGGLAVVDMDVVNL